jgi:adenylate cyclase
LSSEDEVLELPEWVGREVTEIPRYYNISLSQRPYCNWSDNEKNI